MKVEKNLETFKKREKKSIQNLEEEVRVLGAKNERQKKKLKMEE